MSRVFRPWSLLVRSGALCFGCTQGTPATAPPGPEGSAPCSREAVLEDGEDGNHQVLRHGGRAGYIYTFSDELGTTVTPERGASGGRFSMSLGGASGSAYAARFHGRIGQGEVVYAGLGMNLIDPKGPYDASAYQGISFMARRSADSTAALRLKVPDLYTTPEGGRCTECFNDFGVDLTLEEEWTPYVVRYADLAQAPGWGDPRPGSVDTRHLFGFQWQVAEPGAAFDVWIDDVAFIGCPP